MTRRHRRDSEKRMLGKPAAPRQSENVTWDCRTAADNCDFFRGRPEPRPVRKPVARRGIRRSPGTGTSKRTTVVPGSNCAANGSSTSRLRHPVAQHQRGSGTPPNVDTDCWPRPQRGPHRAHRFGGRGRSRSEADHIGAIAVAIQRSWQSQARRERRHPPCTERFGAAFWPPLRWRARPTGAARVGVSSADAIHDPGQLRRQCIR